MSFPFKDALFQAQWLRISGHASAGGADLGECLAIAGAVREPSADSWHDAWTAAAERIMQAGEASLAAGHEISAHAAFLRASNYFRGAYIFLMGPARDPRLTTAYRRQRAAFERAMTTRPGWGESVAIPYEGRALRGLFFAVPADGPRPTVILNGGYDSTAEEAYFYSGPAALARGYNVLCFDGPGQGAALIEDGMVFRPDWENVIAPVLAYLGQRREVDPKRVGLMGLSFGGYLAPRAASGNPALAACIADPGQLSLLEEVRTRLPSFLRRQLPEGNPWVHKAIDGLLTMRLKKPTAGWALRRCLWVHGVERPIDYLRLTAQYTNIDRVEQISCPTLICSAEGDEIGATASRLYDLLECPKASQRFGAAEGAGAHCEAGARLLFNQRVFDWLDEVLARADAVERRAA
jgi:alpha-beta hydrolase superfamily lysophospholipase